MTCRTRQPIFPERLQQNIQSQHAIQPGTHFIHTNFFYRKLTLAHSFGSSLDARSRAEPRHDIRGAGECGAYLDHWLAENERERFAVEAGGGEPRGYDAHRAGAELCRPPVHVCRGRGGHSRRAERQAVEDPRASARGRGVRSRRADRHPGVGTAAWIQAQLVACLHGPCQRRA
jgi:hypothetical protein